MKKSFVGMPGSKVCSSWGILNQDKVPLVHSRLLPFSCGITLRPSEKDVTQSFFKIILVIRKKASEAHIE